MADEHISRPTEPPELAEAAKQFRKDVARARDLEDMMRTAGWKAFVELLQANVDDRTQDVFAPPKQGDYIVEAEWHNKGAVYALLYVMGLPSVIVAATKEATRSEPASEDESE